MKYGRDRMYNNPTMQNSNLLRRFILSCLLLSAFVIFGCSPKSLQVKQGSIKPGEKLAGEIERLEISEEMERTKVAIHGSSPITYTVYKLAEPPRIVVDILQADLGKLMGTIAVNNGTINTIKSTQVDSEAGTVGRIAIGLDKIVDYDVVKETNSLILYVKKSVEQEVPHDAKTHVKEIGTVENIDFKHIMGKSQIKVYTSRKARCNVSRISDDTVVLELIEMEIPERLQQSLYIKETESVVEMIKPYQTVISGIKAVRIDIKLRAMVPYYMFQEENTVQIDFDQPHEAVSRKISATPSPAPVVPKPKIEAAVM
ncbi:MAG: AMIN domain-containing protein, partial [Pseudomonadota bacterium]